MKKITYVIFLIAGLTVSSCNEQSEKKPQTNIDQTSSMRVVGEDGKLYQSEQFGDLRVLHYYIPQWDSLTLRQQELVYYLYEAGLCGRDIMWDQNCSVNLEVRNTLESIYVAYKGDKNAGAWLNFERYLKQLWAHTGIHHHYNSTKLLPEFEKDYFMIIAKECGVTPSENVVKALFDPSFMSMKVESDVTKDLIASSAVNFYEGVTQAEVEKYYSSLRKPGDRSPLEYGLNSKLTKENDVITERPWKVGGLYSSALENVVMWLEKAEKVAENDKQAVAIRKLIEYYKSGDLKNWDDFNISW